MWRLCAKETNTGQKAVKPSMISSECADIVTLSEKGTESGKAWDGDDLSYHWMKRKGILPWASERIPW